MYSLNSLQIKAVNAAVEACEFKPYPNYSGRGMNGKSCYGFAIYQHISPAQAILMVIANLMEQQMKDDEANEPFNYIHEIVETLSNCRTCHDSLGHGTIIYFTNLDIPENWQEEEEEEDEEEDLPMPKRDDLDIQADILRAERAKLNPDIPSEQARILEIKQWFERSFQPY